MKKFTSLNYVLAFLLIALNKFDVTIASLDNGLQEMKEQDQKLELEARLLIDSHQTILDCLRDGKYGELQTIYDKMCVDSSFQRLNKEQIREYQKILQERIDQSVQNEKSNSSLKKILKSTGKCWGLFAITACGCWMLYKLGKSEIISESLRQYTACLNSQLALRIRQNLRLILAKNAVDFSIIVSGIFGLGCSVLWMLELLGIAFISEIETLKKMDRLLIAFEQLSDNSQ